MNVQSFYFPAFNQFNEIGEQWSTEQIYLTRCEIVTGTDISNGKIFKCERDCEKLIKLLNTDLIVKQYAKILNNGWEPIWKDLDQEKYCITYDNHWARFNGFRVASDSVFNYGCIYFKTRKNAQKMIDEMFDELKLIYGIIEPT